MLFIYYPKCSTCQKAKKYLDNRGLKYSEKHIVEEVPSREELLNYIELSGLDISKFFNTSGMKYRELKLKDKLPQMSKEEKLALLASDGMLIKRPLLVSSNKVLVGFKEKEWSEIK